MTSCCQLVKEYCDTCASITVHNESACVCCLKPAEAITVVHIERPLSEAISTRREGIGGRRNKALTMTERAVLADMAAGFDMVEIAARQRTTLVAAKGARHRIFDKLEVERLRCRGAGPKNDAKLIVVARERGLVAQVATP